MRPRLLAALALFTALALALAVATPACGGDAATGAADGTTAADTATADATTPIPGDDAYVEGAAYQAGVYRCCAAGDGTACCAGAPQGTCFAYGGVVGDCAAAGETLEAKDICSHCCAGLARVSPAEPGDGPGADERGCVETAPPSVFVCLPCGDGVCDAGEDRCTCPEDCPGG